MSIDIMHNPEYHDIVFCRCTPSGRHMNRTDAFDIVLHSLEMVNACVGEKLLISAKYSSDDSALLINSMAADTDGATRALIRAYPDEALVIPQTFFTWHTKTLKTYLLWALSDLEVNANVTIVIEIDSFSVGRPENETDECIFVCYLERTEDDE